jgi:DUF971 family protein
MGPETTPNSLDLKRDEKLTVRWSDGKVCVYSLSLLRTMCPCAQCRTARGDSHLRKRTSLSVLPGDFSEPLRATGAQLVGNYALQIEWSDGHATGIYSFEYLREICPATESAK